MYELYVIGDDDIDMVVNTIHGSEYRDRIRSISASQLLMLLEVQEDSGLQHEILTLLLPLDTINVGSLVGLVQDVIEFRKPQPESGQDQERMPEGWTPDIGANAVVGEISRRELSGAADAKVAIFPSREDGIPFLEENNAWGFVYIGQNPEYAGMYITGDVGAVRINEKDGAAAG